MAALTLGDMTEDQRAHQRARRRGEIGRSRPRVGSLQLAVVYMAMRYGHATHREGLCWAPPRDEALMAYHARAAQRRFMALQRLASHIDGRPH